jgi:hypothetical protein
MTSRSILANQRALSPTALVLPTLHPVLKAIFKGAATSVIQQLPEVTLHEHYERMLACGIKPNPAKLTVACRAAAIVLAMWKHQEVYDPAKHVVVTDKA